jgi:hypothetical protein
MGEYTFQRLEELFDESPVMRATEASASEIENAARSLNCSFHEDYAEFLRHYGGGMVGSYPIFGIHKAHVMGDFYSVVDVTRRFRSQGWPGTLNWYVISMDGGGNPIGVDSEGRVWISDHDAGAVNQIAEHFEEFLDRIALAR